MVLLQKPVSIWKEMLQSLFSQRSQGIIESQVHGIVHEFQKSIETAAESLLTQSEPSVLTELDASDWFWAAENEDDQQVLRSRLLTPLLGEVVRQFDNSLQAIQTQLAPLIQSTERPVSGSLAHISLSATRQKHQPDDVFNNQRYASTILL